MGLITEIVGLIRGSVGNNMDNNEDDVMRIKSALNKVGYFKGFDHPPEPHGYITKEMNDSIKSFQKSNGLKVDGILYPNGETELALQTKNADNNQMLGIPNGKVESERLPPLDLPELKNPEEGTAEGQVIKRNDKWREEMDPKILIDPREWYTNDKLIERFPPEEKDIKAWKKRKWDI